MPGSGDSSAVAGTLLGGSSLLGFAVFACYNPPDSLLENCRGILAQGVDVVVVDDGSTEDRSTLYETLRQLGVQVIELTQNSGIAYALNRGIERAFERGAHFAITLDQDTILDDSYVDCVRETLARIGISSPVILSAEKINGYVMPDIGVRDGMRLSNEPLQSGLALSAKTYEIVGPLDEQLFIDCVDAEYYLRARTRGVDTLIAPGTKMTHEIGDLVERRAPRILSPRRKVYLLGEHAPFRLYYIVRNRTRIYARYGLKRPAWLRRSALHLFVTLFNEIVLPPDTKPRLYMALRGLYGAARNEHGRIPAEVLARAEKLSR